MLATGGLLTSVYTSPTKTLCAQMTSPDYAAWDALLKAHVKPSEMRGIGVNVVDYDGEFQLRWFGTAYPQSGVAVLLTRTYVVLSASHNRQQSFQSVGCPSEGGPSLCDARARTIGGSRKCLRSRFLELLPRYSTS